jgi:predicted transcriptional regulator of viral defense system
MRLAMANGGVVTLTAATEALKRYYYANAVKYVGESLSKLVKRGKLIRVKPGVYEIRTHYPDDGQIGLFADLEK